MWWYECIKRSKILCLARGFSHEALVRFFYSKTFGGVCMRLGLVAVLVALLTACFADKPASEKSGSYNQSPVADFSVRGKGLNVQFITQSKDRDGKISKWAWNFGNGATLKVPNPTMTYLSPNVYTVQLTVTDNKGAAHTVSKAVQVDMVAAPVMKQ